MAAPAGISKIIEISIPKITEKTAKTADKNNVVLNPLPNCNEAAAGRIKSEETSITPTTFTASTTVIAVKMTSKELISSV
jgi:hypothetical protein